MTSTPNVDLQPGAQSPSHHHFHHHLHGRRLLEFIHPHTGKTTHVAHTPEEVEKKRFELLRQETKEGDFDVILHGSPQHLDGIRALHSHQELQRDRLKEEHAEVYDQFERVKDELDVLSDELHRLTDHAVALDSSFDRYGYSARLRTKDESETSSLTTTETGHSAKERHQDRTAAPIKFFNRPVVRQYFHQGLLWRSAKVNEVASFEMVIDLVYVGVIDIVGELAVEDPTGLTLLHFIIIFSIGWKIWSDLTMVINWFQIDDVFQRLSVIFYLLCLLGFAVNMNYMFSEEAPTYTAAIAFYITQRLFAGLWYVRVAVLVPMIRGTMLCHFILIVISSALWIGSMHLEWPNQLALIFIPLLIDLFGGIIIVAITKKLSTGKGFGRSLQKHFDFFPAINIEHRVERTNAFVALVFGYSILTILFQAHAAFPLTAFFGKAALGLIQAFVFNWLYFEVDHFSLHVHAIRRHWFSSSLWISGHLPFIMAYVLAAATLSQLVLAHDCSNADPETLGEKYVTRSLAELDTSLRWYYCGGLGVSLLMMAVLSLCHIHKRLENPRLRKRPRLAIRACVAIIIICLPLAHDFTSLGLISTTTGLVILVLCLDLFGNSCAGDRFWSGGFCPKERKNNAYTADCKIGKRKRKQLLKALENGDKVGLADVMKRTPSMTSVDSQETRKDEEWHGGHF